ncbi:MAG: hypothetical protein J2O48_06575 [Solirubrobacterales bacterium]|nr:hypothetical protein [Solirubrobacterales bacterium]
MKKSAAGALALALMLLFAATASASAKQRGPLTGKSVTFACANPANHGNTGHVKLGLAPNTGKAVCLGNVIADASHGNVGPLLTGSPTGTTPTQLQDAYKLSGLDAKGRTVAIVDAYDDPSAETDLAKYRSQYGLPACSTDNGCFKKVNQSGDASPLPSADPGWGEEISLDLDAVSAACPTCHIELYEANSANDPDLLAAQKTAENSHPAAVSDSWGENEKASDETTGDPTFAATQVPVVAGSGDSGYGGFWPAANPHVTAAGGTSLKQASNSRGWTETAWSGSGAGCTLEPKPSWQTDGGCDKRSNADVSADGDPNTGLGIYDTQNSCGGGALCDLLLNLGLAQGADGWVQVGGTSLATPILASVYALAGDNGSGSDGAKKAYANTDQLNDVTSGSDGTCSTSYLCNAGPGYDGPTGLGTPNGTGAF